MRSGYGHSGRELIRPAIVTAAPEQFIRDAGEPDTAD
jgi:hypothetical protein